MKTRAAVLHATHTPFQIETLDLELPKAREVLVCVRAAGVCHSDWHLATGATAHPLPVVAGHEGAGIVEAVGAEVRGVRPGDHVAFNWAPSCGRCFYCHAGRPSLCATSVTPIWNGTLLDGTTRFTLDGRAVHHFSAVACFSQHTVVPEQACVSLPTAVPFPVAALIGCAVTTGVGAVVNTARVPAGSRVAVFGAGGVGLSVVLGARLAGARQIIVIDPVARKREMASASGATDVLWAESGMAPQIRELTEGRGADYVFDAIGRPDVQEQCFNATRPGGMVVLVGLAPMDSQTIFSSALITRQEKTIAGSYYGGGDTSRDFQRYAAMYLDGSLDLDALVSATYPLARINDAYADMLAGRNARGVVIVD